MLIYLVLIILLSYFMLAATTEEKENRAAEMLLTSIKSRSLILGKIMSIFVLGLVQLLVIIVPLYSLRAFQESYCSLQDGISSATFRLILKPSPSAYSFLSADLLCLPDF